MDALDTEFLWICDQIQQLYINLPRALQIRVEQWTRVLSAEAGAWSKNRLSHARLLLRCVTSGQFVPPFDKKPPDDHVRRLPPDVVLALNAAIAADERKAVSNRARSASAPSNCQQLGSGAQARGHERRTQRPDDTAADTTARGRTVPAAASGLSTARPVVPLVQHGASATVPTGASQWTGHDVTGHRPQPALTAIPRHEQVQGLSQTRPVPAAATAVPQHLVGRATAPREASTLGSSAIEARPPVHRQAARASTPVSQQATPAHPVAPLPAPVPPELTVEVVDQLSRLARQVTHLQAAVVRLSHRVKQQGQGQVHTVAPSAHVLPRPASSRAGQTSPRGASSPDREGVPRAGTVPPRRTAALPAAAAAAEAAMSAVASMRLPSHGQEGPYRGTPGHMAFDGHATSARPGPPQGTSWPVHHASPARTDRSSASTGLNVSWYIPGQVTGQMTSDSANTSMASGSMASSILFGGSSVADQATPAHEYGSTTRAGHGVPAGAATDGHDRTAPRPPLPFQPSQPCPVPPAPTPQATARAKAVDRALRLDQAIARLAAGQGIRAAPGTGAESSSTRPPPRTPLATSPAYGQRRPSVVVRALPPPAPPQPRLMPTPLPLPAPGSNPSWNEPVRPIRLPLHHMEPRLAGRILAALGQAAEAAIGASLHGSSTGAGSAVQQQDVPVGTAV